MSAIYPRVTAELIRNAADFRSHQWTQGARAVDRDGRPTEPRDPAWRFTAHRPPVAWSLLGRLEYAADLVYDYGDYGEYGCASPRRTQEYLTEAVRLVAITIGLENGYPVPDDLFGAASLPEQSWDRLVGWNDHPAMTFRSARAALLATAADLERRDVC